MLSPGERLTRCLKGLSSRASASQMLNFVFRRGCLCNIPAHESSQWPDGFAGGQRLLALPRNPGPAAVRERRSRRAPTIAQDALRKRRRPYRRQLVRLDAMLVVFHECLREQDRFFLSKGHSAGALYTTLWSLGRLDDRDLESFHRDDTLLAGHPPAAGIPEISFATGSLGHGLSLAAGTALAFRLKRSDARVVCLTSDGEWQEGSTWEGLIFASHHQAGQSDDIG